MLGQVTVIGCGLIGGSLVKSLRAKGGAVRIAGIDGDDVLALARSYLDDAALPGSGEAASLVARADLVVLATPVGSIVRDLGWVLDAARPDGVVTDTGSVKKVVVETARQHAKAASFVGGHPMAGREVGGFDASTPDLFARANWFLVPSGESAAKGMPLAKVSELVSAVGAEPVVIDPDAHDRAMAYVSHAPQLIASALYGVAAKAGVLGQAGPGFRDVTRISGGPPSMWRDILEANRRQIALALADILGPLEQLRDSLAEGGDPAMTIATDLLDQAHAAKSASSVVRPGERGSAS